MVPSAPDRNRMDGDLIKSLVVFSVAVSVSSFLIVMFGDRLSKSGRTVVPVWWSFSPVQISHSQVTLDKESTFVLNDESPFWK